MMGKFKLSRMYLVRGLCGLMVVVWERVCLAEFEDRD